MGFKVYTQEEMMNENKGCFDGTPAILKQGQLKRNKTYSSTGASGETSTLQYYLDIITKKLDKYISYDVYRILRQMFAHPIFKALGDFLALMFTLIMVYVVYTLI
jgi:hypothetical protein